MKLPTCGLFSETMHPLLFNLVLIRCLSHKTKSPNVTALFTSLYTWEKDLQQPKQYPNPRDPQEQLEYLNLIYKTLGERI